MKLLTNNIPIVHVAIVSHLSYISEVFFYVQGLLHRKKTPMIIHKNMNFWKGKHTRNCNKYSQ